MPNKIVKPVKTFFAKFRILTHPAIQMLLRTVIGFILIYFSLYKIADPDQWAEVIYQFRLVPEGMVNFIAVLTSWVELFAGIGVLLGLFTRASALLATGIVFTFLAALQINIWREVYIYCGCFRKQAYMTDVTYQNRNITFYVLIVALLVLANTNPRWGMDALIEKMKRKKSRKSRS
jgi:uncharacterized membrane protein YphA (DoxX/SURF4 family)